jgi:type II secretory pathway pseudopilin PulG
MIVVALVGILASVGVASFRKQVASSKSAEAASVIQAIRGAEEACRSENQSYLNVSSADSWYPGDGVGPIVRAWEQKTHKDLVGWQRLGPRVTQPVQFGYIVNAGPPGAALPALHIDQKNIDLGTPKDAWYVIQARADFDKDSVFCNAMATSFSPELYVEHEGE